MKKTTYIIIALVILPLALVFLSPFILMLYGEQDDTDILILTSEMKTIGTDSFDRVNIGAEQRLIPTSDQNIVVRHGEACRILVPENLKPLVSCSVDSGYLTLSITNSTDGIRFISGDTLLIIEAPSVKSIATQMIRDSRLVMDGFDQSCCDIDFEGTVVLNNCRMASLSLSDPSMLRLKGSHIVTTDAHSYKSLGVVTSDARIDSLLFSAEEYSPELDYSDANIGVLRLDPRNGQINVCFRKSITINNDDNGSND